MGVAFHFASNPGTRWRGPLGLALLWPALMIVVTFLSPESPRWLLLKGRGEEARAVTRKLHATKGDYTFADEEFKEMALQAEIDSKLESSWVNSPRDIHRDFADEFQVVNVHETIVPQASCHNLLVVFHRTVNRSVSPKSRPLCWCLWISFETDTCEQPCL